MAEKEAFTIAKPEDNEKGCKYYLLRNTNPLSSQIHSVYTCLHWVSTRKGPSIGRPRKKRGYGYYIS